LKQISHSLLILLVSWSRTSIFQIRMIILLIRIQPGVLMGSECRSGSKTGMKGSLIGSARFYCGSRSKFPQKCFIHGTQLRKIALKV
jgi:hypothetical protein